MIKLQAYLKQKCNFLKFPEIYKGIDIRVNKIKWYSIINIENAYKLIGSQTLKKKKIFIINTEIYTSI